MKGLKRGNIEELSEVLVDVNRVTKVLKGGRSFSFSARVISGNGAGLVGSGHGKAKEVTEARRKATQAAKKNLISVPLYQGRTIPHDVIGVSGSAKVLLRRARPGTGVIAGSAMRAVFKLLGIHDIVAKSIKGGSVYSMIDATFDALLKLATSKDIANKRGLKVADLSVIPKK